jgi:hypothetical protein
MWIFGVLPTLVAGVIGVGAILSSFSFSLSLASLTVVTTDSVSLTIDELRSIFGRLVRLREGVRV